MAKTSIWKPGPPMLRNRLPAPGHMGSSKPMGQTVEVLFKYQCMRRGLIPHTPEGDPPCHDMIVFNSLTDKMKSVQVKSTATFKNTHSTKTRRKILAEKGFVSRKGNYKIKAKCFNDRVDLKDTYVTILAVYVIPHDLWYIIPVNKIDAGVLNFFPHIEHSKGKYEKYKENWRAFGKIL